MPIAPLLPGVLGAVIILVIIWDAFETVLVPRRIGRKVRLTRYFYIVTWRLWRAMALKLRRPARREGLLGFFGPISLLLLLLCWASGLILAFALLEMASRERAGLGAHQLGLLLYASGQTFFTLGYGDFTPATTLGRLLAVLEAGLGFGFLGTVVGYLPTMYAAFSQREIEISLMDARAGSPPSAAEFLRRSAGQRDEILRAWERWAAQLLETHISYPQLAYYRSQHSNQSWLGALTTILDSTALILARGEGADGPQARLTFGMARHALVDITQIFVREFRPAATDRLPHGAALALAAQLVDGPLAPEADHAFAGRLADLRILYEPYAQALAAYLVFELPPWAHAQPRFDNWQRAPWDKQLAARHSDEHF
jgi:hypothetical protein